MDVRLRVICFLIPLALLFSFRAQALELNGVAPFTELGNEIYLAGLFVDSRTSDSGELFSDARERKMEIRFSSNMSRRRWTTNWMQSIAINANRDTLVAAADELSEVLNAFADNLSPGDQVEIHFIPGRGTDIRINGTTLASNLAPGIFNLFLSSWIGAVPPSSNFRNALLGVDASSTEQDRFYFIEPTAERIAAVRGWATGEEEAEAEAAAEVEEETVAEVTPPVEPEVETPAAAEETPVEDTTSGDQQLAAETTAESTVEPEQEPAAPEPEPAPEPVAEPEPAIAAFEDNDDSELDLSVDAILAQQEYATGLIRKIYGKVEYPAPAVRRNQEGSVRMRLTLNPNGSIASVAMVEEAPYESLNKEAERAIKSAAPFDPLPGSLQNSTFEIEVPIAFRLTSE